MWGDPYKDVNFFVDTPCIDGMEDFSIFKLVNDTDTNWNLLLLSKLFVPSDVVCISCISLSIYR